MEKKISDTHINSILQISLNQCNIIRKIFDNKLHKYLKASPYSPLLLSFTIEPRFVNDKKAKNKNCKNLVEAERTQTTFHP